MKIHKKLTPKEIDTLIARILKEHADGYAAWRKAHFK